MKTDESTVVDEESAVEEEIAEEEVDVSGDGAVAEAEEPATERREYETVRTLVEFEDSEIVEKARTAATLQAEVKSLEIDKKEKNDKYKSAIDERTNSIKSLLSQIGEGGTFQNVECYVVKDHDDEIRNYYAVDDDRFIKDEPFGYADRQRGLFELETENGRREEVAEWQGLAEIAKNLLLENDIVVDEAFDSYCRKTYGPPFPGLSKDQMIELIQSFDPDFNVAKDEEPAVDESPDSEEDTENQSDAGRSDVDETLADEDSF